MRVEIEGAVVGCGSGARLAGVAAVILGDRQHASASVVAFGADCEAAVGAAGTPTQHSSAASGEKKIGTHMAAARG